VKRFTQYTMSAQSKRRGEKGTSKQNAATHHSKLELMSSSAGAGPVPCSVRK
jgi:hypothetical protein